MKSTKTKMMNGFIISIASIFFLTACKQACIYQIEKPANVHAVDWDNYNDVYTVFWNYYTFCSETKKEDSGKEIMISGWIRKNSGSIHGISANRFSLVEEDKVNAELSYPFVDILGRVGEELQTILDTCDLNKKCFIKGSLIFNCLKTVSVWDESVPEILLENTDNIYFE